MNTGEIDKFGFPVSIEVNESPDAALWRRARVKHQAEIALSELHGRLKFHLGLNDAQKLFSRFAGKNKPAHRQLGSGDKTKGLMILRLYGQYEKLGYPSRAEIARRIYEDSKAHRLFLGNSAAAIAERIGALLKEREDEARANQELKALVEALGMTASLSDNSSE